MNRNNKKNWLERIFVGRSWRSSVAGYVLAILSVYIEAQTRRAADPKAPPVTVESVALGVAVAIVGRLHKGQAERREAWAKRKPRTIV